MENWTGEDKWEEWTALGRQPISQIAAKLKWQPDNLRKSGCRQIEMAR
jgi:hypothetical protein